MTAIPSEIQRLLECSICCDYLTDLRETPCCHHLFCSTCIQSWLQKGTRNCPRCRSTNLTEAALLKNFIVQRFVDNLHFDCPNKLHGCSIQVPKSDLAKHSRVCLYSSERLAEKHKLKLQETRILLSKHREGKTDITDNALYDLAKLFLTEREYDSGKECLQMIKDKKKLNLQDVLILQARIERDTGQYDKALELYAKAYAQVRSIPQRIDLLSAMGQLYLKKAQYEQAQDALSKANDLLPADDESQTKVEILNALGLLAKKCSNVSDVPAVFLHWILSLHSVRSSDRHVHSCSRYCRYKFQSLVGYHF